MSPPRSIPTADRISSLPDSLICHILSFLPTKLAIATSILSKRWTPLWKSVLTLDFDHQSFADFGHFRHFVYSVIVSRDITLPLQSFRISCCTSSDFDPRDVNRFVHAAVQRGIQNLDICIDILDLATLEEETVPGLFRVLSCRTLVVLKLDNFTFDYVPQSIHLPLLKTLHLIAITCLNNVHYMNLFRGCPILEDFYTINVGICQNFNDSVAEFNGFHKLVRAKLLEHTRNFPFVWFRNATFLHAELELIYEFRVPTFHNLTHMELFFLIGESYMVEKWMWKWVMQLLQHCPKLQNLIIEPYCDASCYGPPTIDIDWNDPETVPECLSCRLRTCSLRGFYGFGCELQFVEYILLNSKLLRTMTIERNRNYRLGGHETHKMLVKLLSYPRGSVMCRLLFD